MKRLINIITIVFFLVSGFLVASKLGTIFSSSIPDQTTVVAYLFEVNKYSITVEEDNSLVFAQYDGMEEEFTFSEFELEELLRINGFEVTESGELVPTENCQQIEILQRYNYLEGRFGNIFNVRCL